MCDALEQDVQTKLSILKSTTQSDHSDLQYTASHEQWEASLKKFESYWKETIELIETRDKLQIVYQKTVRSQPP